MELQSNASNFLAAGFRYEESPIVIVGCPLDITSTFRPGTRFAPQAIREASWGLETYSPLLDRDLEDLRICDVGDLNLPQGNLAGALEMVQGYVAALTGDGKFPILIGGEHLISLPAVNELVKHHPDLLVIQLDAHADLRQEYLGESLSHATVMRRIADVLGNGGICQLGVRSSTREEMISAKEMGSLYETGEVLRLAASRPVYLTVDLDVLDPGVAPGVSTPEPGGLTFEQAISLISSLSSLRVVGFDLVELSPLYDPTQQSAIAAAKLLRELILLFCWDIDRK
ncbi:MAG: agmatinase [Deltaproteobacteria bacterium]|nr:MAG: agmatinase [Deltaproteobacteria bacterium]